MAALERTPARAGLGLVILALVAYRLAYHAIYLGDIPFAYATFAEGAIHEQAARDILAHPPLGSLPFHLQGAYAYLLTTGMTIHAWPSLGLLVQLGLVALSLVLAHRSARWLWGERAGRWCTIALLAHPPLMFYENKYVPAALAVGASVAMVAALVAMMRARAAGRSPLGAAAALGVAAGVAGLADPALFLAAPFALMAAFVLARPGPDHAVPEARGGDGWAAALTLAGLLVALTPLAARNLAVTGHADLLPPQEPGLSLFIGNNARSRGLWNDAGLYSARAGTELSELAQTLGVDPDLDARDQAAALGATLGQRARAWIREHPGEFAALEARKLWWTLGDRPLGQSYDWLGERELLPWANRVGVSFSLLLALAVLGAAAVFGGGWRPEPGGAGPDDAGAGPDDAGAGPDDAGAAPDDAGPKPNPGQVQPLLAADAPERRRALGWLLAGLFFAPLAGNLALFSTAAHRLPMVVPAALLAGPGLLAASAALAARFGSARAAEDRVTLPTWSWILAAILLAQGPWPRLRSNQPSTSFYYNLAMVQDEVGDPRAAMDTLGRAIERRPDLPAYRMRRAHLRVRLEDYDAAEDDLDVLDELAADAEAQGSPLPVWILEQAEFDRATIAWERRRLP
ncbi:hypothetical protein G6O69_14180 [Pseudenhygromyxa sp. WMMC2535]|uniref:hypothetical protein n=1 Tax=Pseudenhygromyxa sp. WMMC2535 TaxID=2712867 RepID=UPI00155763D1|nr:hypothetical protein [Pseudenhygromyxa sp. WMMC2535]NVB38986.1 hypothetical protein [Pseudenhygromyxa sp. WMMC2535]